MRRTVSIANLSGRLRVSGAKRLLCDLIVMEYSFYRTRVPFFLREET